MGRERDWQNYMSAIWSVVEVEERGYILGILYLPEVGTVPYPDLVLYVEQLPQVVNSYWVKKWIPL
jgi:hypothetical protein